MEINRITIILVTVKVTMRAVTKPENASHFSIP